MIHRPINLNEEKGKKNKIYGRFMTVYSDARNNVIKAVTVQIFQTVL